MAIEAPYGTVLKELGGVFAQVDDDRVDQACDVLRNANHILVAGCGRELLQLKGFAMRLFHLGLTVAVAGDMTMPFIGAGDVLLVSVGTGELSTMLTLMRLAKDAGATALLVTAQPNSAAAHLADHSIVLPAQTMADDQGSARSSELPMGSLYEGALFVLFEAMVLKLMDLCHVTGEALRSRHSNMA